MANKAKKTAQKTTTEAQPARVTRIKASDSAPTKKAVKAKKVTKKKPVAKKPVPRGLGPFVALGGYFKGAWVELRQVRWPNRRATWSLTAAVLAFSAFFVILIVLLDILFKYLFELILG